MWAGDLDRSEKKGNQGKKMVPGERGQKKPRAISKSIAPSERRIFSKKYWWPKDLENRSEKWERSIHHHDVELNKQACSLAVRWLISSHQNTAQDFVKISLTHFTSFSRQKICVWIWTNLWTNPQKFWGQEQQGKDKEETWNMERRGSSEHRMTNAGHSLLPAKPGGSGTSQDLKGLLSRRKVQ